MQRCPGAGLPRPRTGRTGETDYLICDTRAGRVLWSSGSEKTRSSNRCLLCSSHVTWNFFRCSFSWFIKHTREDALN